MAVTAGIGDGLRHAIFEQCPVGQTGKDVVVCLMHQLLVQPVALCHILHQGKGDLASVVLELV